MRFLLFLLSFWFFLLNGYDHAYAETHPHKTRCSSAHLAGKSHQVKAEKTGLHSSRIKSKKLPGKKEDLISLENEVDDISFGRKYVLLSECILTIAYASFLFFIAGYLKNRLPFCWHLSYISSYKYILQRVLRL